MPPVGAPFLSYSREEMASSSPMLKNARNPEALFCGCYDGCSCHNSKQTRRAGKKKAKAKERRFWRRDQAEQS